MDGQFLTQLPGITPSKNGEPLGHHDMGGAVGVWFFKHVDDLASLV